MLEFSTEMVKILTICFIFQPNFGDIDQKVRDLDQNVWLSSIMI